MLLKASGKTENEEELFSLKIGVFDHQGICLDYEAGEVLEDKISFSEGKELWLLENGDFVVICCIGYEGTDGHLYKQRYRNCYFKRGWRGILP